MIKIFVLILLTHSGILNSQELTLKQKNNYAWQIALDAKNFSPGLIDGIWGGKTSSALKEYLDSIDYSGTISQAKVDKELLSKLNVLENDVFTKYTISDQDISEIGHIPKNWNERAELKKMTYESLPELVQGKFHCSLKSLKKLNPTIDFKDYAEGAVLTVPNIRPYKKINIKKLEIDLIERKISGYDDENNKILLLNCSVARSKENLPKSDTFIKNKALNPNYTFNPKYWPEIKNVDKVLIIQPGPKNPVGLAWISLNLPGYGVHGTPVPDNIGKTGSHGCIRLTNWHAIHLLKSINVGVPVIMIGKSPSTDYLNSEDINTIKHSEDRDAESSNVQILQGDQRVKEDE